MAIILTPAERKALCTLLNSIEEGSIKVKQVPDDLIRLQQVLNMTENPEKDER